MIDTIQPKPDIWESNPKLKSLLLLLIVVFLLCGIGLAVFAQVQNNYRQKVYEETKAGLPKHQAGLSANQNLGESDISTWKTYKNTKYGFEFKYPDNVGIINEETSQFAGPPTDPEEGLLLIADKEGTFSFQVWNGKLSVSKKSELGDKVLSTFKYNINP